MKLLKWGTAPFLIVLAGFYSIVSSVRNFLFDVGFFRSYTSALPIICVGNCTVGGTGKTPLVRELVPLLRSYGHTPVVLSRGYGGVQIGPYLVSQTDSARDVGDEPKLLASDKKLPVIISRSRVAGAQFIEKQKLGTVIILDDGYQHRWLNRTLNILCLNVATDEARKQIVAGRTLPWGIFRESLRSALQRADLIVFSFRSRVMNPVDLSRGLMQILPEHIPVLYSTIGVSRVVSTATGAELAAQSVVALCAIANPEGFLLTLTQMGFVLERTRLRADHSPAVEADCQELLRNTSLPIVVTEKDLAKISMQTRNSGRIFVLEMKSCLEPKELLDGLLKKLPIA